MVINQTTLMIFR